MIVVYFITGLIFLWYVTGIIRVIIIERKIKEIDCVMQKKKDELKKNPGLIISTAEGLKKRIEEEYKPRIDRLERDRRFILDKLPLLKK